MMKLQMMTRSIAWAAAQDAANGRMFRDSRITWNVDDFELATVVFNELWPEYKDIVVFNTLWLEYTDGKRRRIHRRPRRAAR